MHSDENSSHSDSTDGPQNVLMPCRALDAFGPRHSAWLGAEKTCVLMPCRALDAFGLQVQERPADRLVVCVLMPCRALDAFGLRQYEARAIRKLRS